MANVTSPLLPATEELLKEFGERLRLARLRRRLQAKEVAQRAGMTEVTLRRVERGLPGVTMGAYLAVMQVLQLQGDVAGWATHDPLGRDLQDADLQRTRRPRRMVIKATSGNAVASGRQATVRVQQAARPTQFPVASEYKEKPEGTESVSATDLLKTLDLSDVKPASKKRKA